MSFTTPAADAALAILFGIVVTLCVRGYRYGESNHAVYLLDALRRLDPTLLEHDWWTQNTLQYHFVFNAVSGWLMRLDVIEPAFLLGYLALAVLQHVGWYRLTLRLGGDAGAYVLSVVLYHLLAAGLALGSYHVLQDSSFLPSNLSNVAMLWGILFWVAGRRAAAAAALGVAGLFHINHALMAIGLWFALGALEVWRAGSRAQSGAVGVSGEASPSPGTPGEGRGEGAVLGRDRNEWVRWLGSTILLLALCAPAIAPAVKTVLTRSGTLPLREFVDLFVHLRHPHHFDPLTWHLALWLVFLLPVPLAAVYARDALRGPRGAEVARAVDAFLVIAGVTGVALLGAGVWFVSETLVQLNLYRFSIYLKLLACIGAGCWLAQAGALRPRPRVAMVVLLAVLAAGLAVGATAISGPAATLVQRNAPGVLLALVAAAAAVLLVANPRVPRTAAGVAAVVVAIGVAVFWPRLGLTIDAVRGDPPAYVALARWARDHTPKEAVFLVPPDEQSFRLHARRAIVVNFKNVPQLSAELPEWRDRLQQVLNLPDLMALPRGMGRTLAAIGERYASLPPEHLAHTAGRYGARYVVAANVGQFPPESGLRLVHQVGPYGLYIVGDAPQGERP